MFDYSAGMPKLSRRRENTVYAAKATKELLATKRYRKSISTLLHKEITPEDR